MAGVKAVFLLTAPGAWVPDHDLALLDAARAAGVGKVVKLSAIGTEVGGWHHPGEQALRDGDEAWTLLRPSSFASNTFRWAEAIKGGQPVPNRTGTGAQGVVDPRDVAAVAVEALLTDEHDGQTYTLTGPEPLSVPDQVAQLSEVLGRPIEIVEVPPEVERRQLLAAGFDSSVVEVAMRGSELVRGGGNVTVTDDVDRVLGRPAGTFKSWAHDHRTIFQAGSATPSPR